MKKARPTGFPNGKPPPDRAINMDELSELSGLSKCALYHLRSHRPTALPPPLTGDAYRNSAMYLLSSTLDWLRKQQEVPPTPPSLIAGDEGSGHLSPPQKAPALRPGRPRK
jgi:hypothetical protein